MRALVVYMSGSTAYLHRDIYKCIIEAVLEADQTCISALAQVCMLFDGYVRALYPLILRRNLRRVIIDENTDFILIARESIDDGNRFKVYISTCVAHSKLRIGEGHVSTQDQSTHIVIIVGHMFVLLSVGGDEEDVAIASVEYKGMTLPLQYAHRALDIARSIYPEVPELRAIRR